MSATTRPRNSISLSWSMCPSVLSRSWHAPASARGDCRGSYVRCRRADSSTGMLSPEVDDVDAGRTPAGGGARAAAAGRRRRAGRGARAQAPGGARAARARRGPHRHRRPPRGRAVARRTPRTPRGRPCTPTSPGCAPTSARRRPGCRPARTATGSTSPPTTSTSRRRGRCSRRPARDPAGALARLREAHALWRGPVLADLTDVAPIAVAVEGCARLHREVTDALVAAPSTRAGRAERRSGSPPRRSPRTRCASRPCCC